MKTPRKGLTLVEVLVSVAILGLALAPIVGMLHKSFGDIRAEKDEATAAGVAGQLLNQILFEAPYAQVKANGYVSAGPPSETIMPAGNKTVDGTYVEWDTTVQPVSGLKFKFNKYKYHNKHTGAEPVPGSLTDGALFYTDSGSGTTTYDKQVGDVDTKYNAAPISGQVMVEVELKVRWRPPGVTATKEEKLYVRRAMLE
jgi:prepilin-type N-terminal cleavage/methylation domain-containing protein